MKQAIAALCTLALAGCTSTGLETTPDTVAGGPMTCNAGAAQAYVGRQASQQTGAAIQQDSGARSLRWGPPNSAWTMDYREDRVNVRYDEAMKIVEITCG
jgi:hypothetical protein